MYSAFLLAFQYFLMLPYFIFKCNSFLFFSHFFQYLNLVFTYFIYCFSLKNYHAQPLNSTKKRRFLYISYKNVSFSIWFQKWFLCNLRIDSRISRICDVRWSFLPIRRSQFWNRSISKILPSCQRTARGVILPSVLNSARTDT